MFHAKLKHSGTRVSVIRPSLAKKNPRMYILVPDFYFQIIRKSQITVKGLSFENGFPKIARNKHTHTSNWPWKWPFRPDTTINRSKGGQRQMSVGGQRQTSEGGEVGGRWVLDRPKADAGYDVKLWHPQFWSRYWLFLPGKITVATRDDKLNDGVTICFCLQFLNF